MFNVQCKKKRILTKENTRRSSCFIMIHSFPSQEEKPLIFLFCRKSITSFIKYTIIYSITKRFNEVHCRCQFFIGNHSLSEIIAGYWKVLLESIIEVRVAVSSFKKKKNVAMIRMVFKKSLHSYFHYLLCQGELERNNNPDKVTKLYSDFSPLSHLITSSST